MNELLEPFNRMLEGMVTPAAVRAIEDGGTVAAIWDELAASGFLDALVAQDEGGAGLSLAEIGPLLQALGRYAVPLPVAETMVARQLLAGSGQAVPHGSIAFATFAGGETIVPFGRVAEHVLLDLGDRLVLAGAGDGQPGPTGACADLSARMHWHAAPSGPTVARPEGGLRAIAALVRAAAIAGGAARLLDLTVSYANERVQFGKPIGRQQALQQQLAVMAEDGVAARMAAELGCAGGLPVRLAAVATAKSVASAAAARIANTAHAVHGAIGISQEYDLQLYSRRLHEWRLADGSESYWNRILGVLRQTGPDNVIDWVRAEIFG